MGAVTPIGNDVETFWEAVKKGVTGIGPITKFDTTEYKVKLAAEVKGFVAKERMDFKAAKRMELFSQYFVAGAQPVRMFSRYRSSFFSITGAVSAF